MLNTLPTPLPDSNEGDSQRVTAITPASAKGALVVPFIFHSAGDKAAHRFLEFFGATIRNKNTRAAYLNACHKFFRWCDARGVVELSQIKPLLVAAFIEEETHLREPQTVKQELAALRQLFDYLVTGHIIETNPATSVKGPAYSLDQGKTPILSRDQARTLLDSIPLTKKDGRPDLIGLRDRALIGLMIFSFARVSAVIGMKVEDYRQNGKRYQVQLHEKGGKFHRLPVHHSAEEYLDAYIEAAGLGEEKKMPLFRSTTGCSGVLNEVAMSRGDVLRMIKRRAKAADLPTDIGCHTFRGTGITAYLENKGTIENAQMIAQHKSPRTTKLYDRRRQDVALDEIERIQL
ncbi:tyrosine recombinase XerC (plasmid) [Abditibacteriota bacterium]|nr:tyrosine recombinase XerC [Abditibacteriota bacterium]